MAVAWNWERGASPCWYHLAEPWTATFIKVEESEGRSEVQLLWLLWQQWHSLESLLTSSKQFFLVNCPPLPFSPLLTAYANSVQPRDGQWNKCKNWLSGKVLLKKYLILLQVKVGGGEVDNSPKWLRGFQRTTEHNLRTANLCDHISVI